MKITSKSMAVVKTSERLESDRILCHHLLNCWPVYRVGAHRGTIQGIIQDLTLIYLVDIIIIEFAFCLDQI
jgi:hypothetical protein